MAKYTSNYKLHQWEPTDNFLRTDFNEDFAKIDAALAGKPDRAELSALQTAVDGKTQIVTGSYTGNGSSQTISLGFQPKMVIIPAENSYTATAVPGSDSSLVKILSYGFQVTYYSSSASINISGKTYYYLALK